MERRSRAGWLLHLVQVRPDFEVITRRYERASTVITTNKPFSQWNEVFPNATCVVTLIDRLTHHAEVIQIEADSYRLKEAKERTAEKTKRRRDNRLPKPGPASSAPPL